MLTLIPVHDATSKSDQLTNYPCGQLFKNLSPARKIAKIDFCVSEVDLWHKYVRLPLKLRFIKHVCCLTAHHITHYHCPLK